MKLYLWLSTEDGEHVIDHNEYTLRDAQRERKWMQQDQGYEIGPLKIVTLTAPRTTKRKAKK